MSNIIFRNERSRLAMEQAYQRLLAETPQARPRSVKTRFGETHMLVAGPEQAPPLVVVHGGMGNSALALWDGGPLLDRFRVHALDVLGQSVKGADVRLRMNSTDYGEWMVDVLDALELPKAHVYGASLGGYILRRLAEVAPDRIDRLAMLVPAGIISGPLLQGITRNGIPLALYRTTGSKAALRRFLDSLFTVPDPLFEEYLGHALKHYKLDLALPPLGTPEPLAAFRRPTLIMAASDDITGPGRPMLARAAQLFPHATLELLENHKHIPPTDPASRARLCARVTRFFLEEVA
jgi:2-hydroxy-6-oxonona-2,4-dienedioate hydrolase